MCFLLWLMLVYIMCLLFLDSPAVWYPEPCCSVELWWQCEAVRVKLHGPGQRTYHPPLLLLLHLLLCLPQSPPPLPPPPCSSHSSSAAIKSNSNSQTVHDTTTRGSQSLQNSLHKSFWETAYYSNCILNMCTSSLVLRHSLLTYPSSVFQLDTTLTTSSSGARARCCGQRFTSLRSFNRGTFSSHKKYSDGFPADPTTCREER